MHMADARMPKAVIKIAKRGRAIAMGKSLSRPNMFPNRLICLMGRFIILIAPQREKRANRISGAGSRAMVNIWIVTAMVSLASNVS